MRHPYIYLATGKSRDVQRAAPTGARAAIHFPELGRTIELWADGEGRWSLDSLPAPGVSGHRTGIARGVLAKGGETIRVYPRFDSIEIGT